MNPAAKQRFARRVKVLLAIFWLGLAGVLVRSAQLQISRHDSLEKLAKDQYLDDIKIPARRGHIYDRNGKPLAISVDVPSVYAHPMRIEDPRVAARALAPRLGVKLDTLYRRLASERAFVWLKRHVTPEVAEDIRSMELEGIGLTKESKRYYPNKTVAAHVVGFAGVDAKGLEGIERKFETELAGEPQIVEAARDRRGRAVLEGGIDEDHRARGADVWLTLDLQIQHAAHVALDRIRKKHDAKSASAVVLDVASGEVLAMAVEPAFNPNRPGESSAAHRRNRVLTDMFEPGSTMKPLVVAAALEAEVLKRDDTIFCQNGEMTVGGHTIRDGKAWGWLTPDRIIQKSSNIGAAKVGALLGRDALATFLNRYGFAKRTGISFPGESPGSMRPPAKWSDLGMATIPFGQGVAVNALQLAAAYRVLAADGEYVQPQLVRNIEGPVGARHEADTRRPWDRRRYRILSPGHAQSVRGMMELAVGPEGSGFRAQVPGYRVAGKTGTAQKADPVAGGYSADRFVAAFAGIAPADNPRIVVVVMVDEPKGEHQGGQVAAPVFSEIAGAALSQLGVLPTEVVTDDVRGALERLSAMVTDAPPALDAPQPLDGKMPSFIGLTAREAVARYVELGTNLDLSIQGTGRVVKQTPSSMDAKGARRVTLVLKP